MVPWMYEHILTLLIFSPLVGIVILAAVPKRHEEAASEIALTSSGITLFIALIVFNLFKFEGRFVFSEVVAWLPGLGSSYHVAVDGLSLLLNLAAAFAVLISVLIVWKRAGSRNLFMSILFFEIGLIGFFSSVDLLLMYIFMEISVFSLVAAILFSGGPCLAGRQASASGLKTTCKTYISRCVGFMSLSSAIFLVVVVFLMLAADSADLMIIESVAISSRAQVWIFAILLVGVFCRMGLFPFHSWVHDLFGKEKDSFGQLLIGFIFVSGAYFFYRILPPFFVAAALAHSFVTWVVAGSIVISALISIAQRDFKALLIYVVMAHFGLALLGLVSMTPQGFAGFGMQIIALLVSLAALTVISAVFKRRGICFLLIVLAMACLPGLSHFPGILMVLMGLFKGGWVLAMVVLLGIIFIVSALIRMFGATLLYDDLEERKGPRLTFAEFISVMPFIILIVGIGIFPDIVLKYVKQSTEAAWVILSHQI